MWTILHCPFCFPFVVWCKEQKAFAVEDVLFYNFLRCTAIMLIALGSGRFFCCGTQVSQSGYVSWQHFYSREVKGEIYETKFVKYEFWSCQMLQIWIGFESSVIIEVDVKNCSKCETRSDLCEQSMFALRGGGTLLQFHLLPKLQSHISVSNVKCNIF